MVRNISLRSAGPFGLLLILVFFGRMGGGRELGSSTEANVPSKMISNTASIVLDAPLQEVFPLFGPIEERKWADGWNPEVVFSETATADERMVFRPRMDHDSRPTESLWVVSKYSAKDAVIEYTIFAPGRMGWIAVRCASHAGGTQTRATVAYSFLGLTEAGRAANTKALNRIFADNLKDWEVAINHYLKTGECLRVEHRSEGDGATGPPPAATAGGGSR